MLTDEQAYLALKRAIERAEGGAVWNVSLVSTLQESFEESMFTIGLPKVVKA